MFCHTISCLNIPISAFQWKWPPLWPYTGRNYTSLSYSLSLSLFFPFNIREEMRSLQAALQKQLDEAAERAEKHQATVRHLNKWRWKMMECFCSSDSSSIWWRQNDHYPHLNSNAQGVDLIFNFFYEGLLRVVDSLLSFSFYHSVVSALCVSSSHKTHYEECLFQRGQTLPWLFWALTFMDTVC